MQPSTLSSPSAERAPVLSRGPCAGQIFGSSGWLQRPPGGTLASYTACLPRNHSENLHVKTIAHTRHTLRAGADPHHFVYAEPYYAVNEDRERVDGAKSSHASMEKVSHALMPPGATGQAGGCPPRCWL